MSTFTLDVGELQNAHAQLAAIIRELRSQQAKLRSEMQRLDKQSGYGIQRASDKLFMQWNSLGRQISNLESAANALRDITAATEQANMTAYGILQPTDASAGKKSAGASANGQDEDGFQTALEKLYGFLKKGKKVYGGNGDFMDLVIDLLEKDEDGSLRKEWEKITENFKPKGFLDGMKVLGYLEDAVDYAKAMQEGDYEAASDIAVKDLQKALGKIYNPKGSMDSFFLDFMMNMGENAYEALREYSVGEHSDWSGFAKSADLLWRSTAGALGETIMEKAWDIYEGIAPGLGIDVDETYPDGLDSFYEQIGNLTEAVIGKEGKELLLHNLSMGETVMDLQKGIEEVKSGIGRWIGLA